MKIIITTTADKCEVHLVSDNNINNNNECIDESNVKEFTLKLRLAQEKKCKLNVHFKHSKTKTPPTPALKEE